MPQNYRRRQKTTPPSYHALRKEKKFHAVETVVSYG